MKSMLFALVACRCVFLFRIKLLTKRINENVKFDLGLDMVMESGDDYVVNEIEKTKRKLKDISSILETQQTLLRLIVQVCKMTKIVEHCS